MTAGSAEVYAEALLAQAPRLLGAMDREAPSPTAGCCDRRFWAWKFVDFPAPRFQESVCALAYLHATPLPGSPYHGNPRLLEWIAMALRYWAGLQHADGSFDEAYPFERSLAATAFTAFYVAEALEWAGEQLPPEVVAPTRAAVLRAAGWLVRHDETHGVLSNHLAAAAAALHHAWRISGDAALESRCRFFLDRILDHQSGEGWYEEYGGADPGYQSHGSFYLARYLELSGDERVAESLLGSVRFLAHFAHPDGSFGGEYGSRNTQTYYPAAFEMLASRSGEAAWLADAMRPSVASGAAVGAAAIDAHNLCPLVNNLVFAHRARCDPNASRRQPVEPSPGPGRVVFPEAGIVRVRRRAYDAYVATTKGGVVQVFDRLRGRLVYSDCGYVGRSRRGALVATQYADPHRRVSVGEDRIEVEGGLVAVSRPTLSPWTLVGFRLFTLSIGRLAPVARWLKDRLVYVLIRRRRPLDLRFERSIEFAEDEVVVRDRLRGGEPLARLGWAVRFATIHMGSSRYFVPNELEPAQLTEPADSTPVDLAALAAGVELRRAVRIRPSPADG